MSRRSGLGAVAAAAAASLALVGGYAAAGGGRFQPTPPANPCTPRPWQTGAGAATVTEQVLLSAIDGAACRLGVSREELILALRSDADRHALAASRHLTDGEISAAVRAGLHRAVSDARANGALGDRTASLLDALIDHAPIGALVTITERILG